MNKFYKNNQGICWFIKIIIKIIIPIGLAWIGWKYFPSTNVESKIYNTENSKNVINGDINGNNNHIGDNITQKEITPSDLYINSVLLNKEKTKEDKKIKETLYYFLKILSENKNIDFSGYKKIQPNVSVQNMVEHIYWSISNNKQFDVTNVDFDYKYKYLDIDSSEGLLFLPLHDIVWNFKLIELDYLVKNSKNEDLINKWGIFLNSNPEIKNFIK